MTTFRPINLNPTTSKNLTTRRHKGRKGKSPNVVGIHTAEAPENPRTAENLGNYFLNVDASTHWSCDNNSRVRSVEDVDTSWTSPGAANITLNIELAGYARQTKADWADAYSIDMLEIAALCSAEWAIKYNIRVRKLTDDQLRRGEDGFAGHVDINRVFKKSTHWDPGPNFPWEYFLDRVRVYVDALKAGGSKPLPERPVTPSWNNAGFTEARIREVQTLLNKLGAKLEVDGKRGPKTTMEIKAFQKGHGLDVDGYPGPKTFPKLKEVANKSSSTSTPQKPTSKKDIRPLQRAIRADDDNRWGPDTDKRFYILRKASLWGGRNFPEGVRAAQQVVGTPTDGSWGPKSKRAHDQVVSRVQKALLLLGYNPGKIDGLWGPSTEAAYLAARKEHKNF